MANMWEMEAKYVHIELFGYVIMQKFDHTKTNFRYVRSQVFTLKTFGTQNKLALSRRAHSKSCLLKLRLKYAKASL